LPCQRRVDLGPAPSQVSGRPTAPGTPAAPTAPATSAILAPPTTPPAAADPRACPSKYTDARLSTLIRGRWAAAGNGAPAAIPLGNQQVVGFSLCLQPSAPLAQIDRMNVSITPRVLRPPGRIAPCQARAIVVPCGHELPGGTARTSWDSGDPPMPRTACLSQATQSYSLSVRSCTHGRQNRARKGGLE
jgi:hypothetical protein